MVEARGNSARWSLSAGQAHDVTQAEPLLAGIDAEEVVADKAYDSDELIETIHDHGAETVILPWSNRQQPREFDQHVYNTRNLVEHFFKDINHFRRVATRYDKLDGRYEAFIAVASVLIWLA